MVVKNGRESSLFPFFPSPPGLLAHRTRLATPGQTHAVRTHFVISRSDTFLIGHSAFFLYSLSHFFHVTGLRNKEQRRVLKRERATPLPLSPYTRNQPARLKGNRFHSHKHTFDSGQTMFMHSGLTLRTLSTASAGIRASVRYASTVCFCVRYC